MNEPQLPAQGIAQRTDPRSFIVQAVMGLRNAVLPIVAVLFAMRGEGFGLALALLAGGLIIAVAALQAYLAWYKFTYRINPEDIRVEQGLLSRTARSVPFERIQDVSLEQGLVARLLGLVEVKFETGSGGGEDIALRYLTEPQGAQLRELVREHREGDGASSRSASPGDSLDEPAEEQAELLFAMGPERLLTFGMFEFSLAVVAVFFGLTQQFDFLLPFELWDLEGWQERLAGPGAWLAGLGAAAQIIGLVIALLTLFVLGFGTGIVRTFLRDWGFRLERTARGFRRRRGLLTRTDVVMPVHRVQAIKVGTRPLRYRFGWHGLSFVSLAQDQGAANHVVAPFAKLDELDPIIRAAGFEPAREALDWQRTDRRYWIDSALIEGGMLVAVAAAVGIFASPLYAAVPLIILVPVVLSKAYGWRVHRYAAAGEQLLARSGWLSPRTQIAQRVKLHSVEIAQGPIARHRGYCSLVLGLAGGSFAIAGLPIKQAKQMRCAVLASIATADFSRINEATSAQ